MSLIRSGHRSFIRSGHRSLIRSGHRSTTVMTDQSKCVLKYLSLEFQLRRNMHSIKMGCTSQYVCNYKAFEIFVNMLNIYSGRQVDRCVSSTIYTGCSLVASQGHHVC